MRHTVRSVSAIFLLLLASLASAQPVPNARASLKAVYFRPSPNEALPGVGDAFARALGRNTALIENVFAPATVEPSLVPSLSKINEAYRTFHFPETAQLASDLLQTAEQRGGGDLNQRQLSEIYLNRGLARLETNQADLAWDDLIASARLDPARVLDPARFQPRVVAAYRRAATEAASSAHCELTFRLPIGAHLFIDGGSAQSPVSILIGRHFVRVVGDGLVTWEGMVSATSPREQTALPLRALEPPDARELSKLSSGANAVVLGALIRSDDGWRFLARRVETATGQVKERTERIDLSSLDRVVEETVGDVMGHTTLQAAKKQSRWWPWVLAGGVVASLAITIPLGVVYSRSTPSGNVGGPIGPLR